MKKKPTKKPATTQAIQTPLYHAVIVPWNYTLADACFDELIEKVSTYMREHHEFTPIGGATVIGGLLVQTLWAPVPSTRQSL